MKRTVIITGAVALMALLGVAIAQEVYSVNVVGFVKKQLPAGGVILTTCNFDPVGGGTNTLLSVFGTNQLKQAAGNYLLGDRILLWDTAQQKYQGWCQRGGVFYKANSATEWGQAIAGDPTIPAGVGMWIIAGSGGTTKDLVFMGEVVDVATQSVQIVSGAQLISYPFTSPIALQDTDFVNDGATKNNNYLLADRILVWLGSSYQAYALFGATDPRWFKANNPTEWGQHVAASNTLDLAEAFWYVAKGGFNWTEGSKYIGNL